MARTREAGVAVSQDRTTALQPGDRVRKRKKKKKKVCQELQELQRTIPVGRDYPQNPKQALGPILMKKIIVQTFACWALHDSAFQ